MVAIVFFSQCCCYPHSDLLHHFIRLLTSALKTIHREATQVDPLSMAALLLPALWYDFHGRAILQSFSISWQEACVLIVPLPGFCTVVMVKPLRYKQIEFFPTSSNVLFIISFWVILTLLWMFSIFLSVESRRVGRSSRKGWKCF